METPKTSSGKECKLCKKKGAPCHLHGGMPRQHSKKWLQKYRQDESQYEQNWREQQHTDQWYTPMRRNAPFMNFEDYLEKHKEISSPKSSPRKSTGKNLKSPSKTPPKKEKFMIHGTVYEKIENFPNGLTMFVLDSVNKYNNYKIVVCIDDEELYWIYIEEKENPHFIKIYKSGEFLVDISESLLNQINEYIKTDFLWKYINKSEKSFTNPQKADELLKIIATKIINSIDGNFGVVPFLQKFLGLSFLPLKFDYLEKLPDAAIYNQLLYFDKATLKLICGKYSNASKICKTKRFREEYLRYHPNYILLAGEGLIQTGIIESEIDKYIVQSDKYSYTIVIDDSYYILIESSSRDSAFIMDEESFGGEISEDLYKKLIKISGIDLSLEKIRKYANTNKYVPKYTIPLLKAIFKQIIKELEDFSRVSGEKIDLIKILKRVKIEK